MITVRGDFWTYCGKHDPSVTWKGVTTNGIVKHSGELVMGAGIALEFKRRYPRLPAIFAEHVQQNGNVPCFVREHMTVSFPTKHHYKNKSDLTLIRNSTLAICRGLNANGGRRVILTPPGCGNGGLSWDAEVLPLLRSLEEGLGCELPITVVLR